MKSKFASIILASLISLALLSGFTMAQNNGPQFEPYCPPENWTKTNATESFEDLLKGQEVNLFEFEDLLNQYGEQFSGQDNATLLASFEELLRRQTVLHESFSSILGNETKWNFADPDEQAEFLKSFGVLLAQEKELYESFYQLLNDTWCNPDFITATGECPVSTHEEFLYSFDDLLYRQEMLLHDYYYLTTNLNPTIPIDDVVEAIATFEDLLRWHAYELGNLEDLIKNPCTVFP